MKAWSSFMDKYYPDGDKDDINAVFGYAAAETLFQVLSQCGNDLSRENIMRQAASLRGYRSSVALPGITFNTGPADFHPIKQLSESQGAFELFFDGLGSLVRQWLCRTGWWKVALALGLAVLQMIFGGLAALISAATRSSKPRRPRRSPPSLSSPIAAPSRISPLPSASSCISPSSSLAAWS